VIGLVIVVAVLLVLTRPSSSPLPAASAAATLALSAAPVIAQTGPSASPAPETAIDSTSIPVPSAAATPPGLTPRPTLRPTLTPSACTPTDQDRYVYNPSRLAVQAACIRVTGVVEAVRTEADGDYHILVALDRPSAYLLRPANQGEELGDLVVEPVCERSVTQSDAQAVCAADPDPLPGPLPTVGMHVWLEGRYVLDLEHGSWAELHPLYRWGLD